MGTLPATLNPNQTLALQVPVQADRDRSRNREAYRQQQLDHWARRPRWLLSGTGTAVASPKLTLSAVEPELRQRGRKHAGKSMTLALTSAGTSAVTVNSAAISGTGFKIVAQSFPVTLNANQSVTLQVRVRADQRQEPQPGSLPSAATRLLAAQPWWLLAVRVQQRVQS